VRRLLERIGARQAEQDLVDSVLEHLRRILNTRQGNVLTAPDYGMPDLTEFVQAPDAQRALQTGILNSIRRYEPRLRRVNVTFAGTDGLSVLYDVSAALRTGGEVRFETSVDSSGLIRVRR
jgi:type VI secretion system protein